MGYRICQKCVMDTTDPDIRFYGSGGCSNCRSAKIKYRSVMKNKGNVKELAKEIRRAGRGKKYDCIIGLSGGVDSSYVAYLVKKLHLRPLAVHLDNGWDSELSSQNMKRILDKLGIDLYTWVIDWEEFRDLQLAFFKAGVPDIEVPTDHAIYASLYKIAAKYHVQYIIDGWNVETESVLPKAWSHGHWDWKYIRAIHRKFGTKRLKTFPHRSRYEILYYEKVLGIKKVAILNYIPYNKEQVKQILREKLGWRDYGDKHEESLFTKFYQNYILPKRFGYDKRRMHLSSLIVSGQITREEALLELQKPLYPEEQMKRDKRYVCEKLGISEQEMDDLIYKLPKRSYCDYPNQENDVIHKLLKI